MSPPMRWSILGAAMLSCGARSDLGAPIRTDAAPPNLPCAQAPAGTTVWQTTLPQDQTFTGPAAADDDGSTYYLGVDQVRYPNAYTVAALDSCGNLTWRSAPLPAKALNGASADLVVTSDQVIYQWGTIDAFDRATGAHRWNVDLDAYAGEKLALDDAAEIGPLAVAEDGNAFLVMTYAAHSVILQITSSGALSTVVGTIRGSLGDISGFILDGDDHLDTLFNSVDGMIVTSYARDGSFVFSSALACNASFLGPLASGKSFIAMQSGPCFMDFTGATIFSPPVDEANGALVAIDGASNVYVVGGQPALTSLDPTGHTRWASSTTDLTVSSPLLASGGHVFVAQVPASIATQSATVSLVEYDASTGASIASYPTGVVYPKDSVPTLPLLVTAAGQLVFAPSNAVTAISAGAVTDTSALWPTTAGTPDHRNSAR